MNIEYLSRIQLLILSFALISFILIDCSGENTDDQYLSLDHYWVEYQHQVDDVNGIETDIANYYGGISGEPDSTFESFSQAYCAIFKYQDNIDMWAQLGIGKFRLEGNQYVHSGFRAEVKGKNADSSIYWDYRTSFGGVDPPQPPADGDTVSLCIQLDVSTGIWNMDADTNFYYFPAVASWKTPGTHVGWDGEVTHVENYMPGTGVDFTVFQELRYRKGSDEEYDYAHHSPDDICRNDDYTLWGIDPQYDASHITEIWIYDKRRP